MGFNTVAFILNDFAHYLEESPHATAELVGNPYVGSDNPSTKRAVEYVAKKHGERVPHPQAIQVLPSFHASNRKYFTAGGNCISELQYVRTYKDRKTGKRLIVLELPDYLQDKNRV